MSVLGYFVRASESANDDVESVEPSSTMMISNVRRDDDEVCDRRGFAEPFADPLGGSFGEALDLWVVDVFCHPAPSKYDTVASSMAGNRSVSSKAGTMMLSSTVAGSSSLGSGKGSLRLSFERYSSSEGCVRIGGGDHRRRRRYACLDEYMSALCAKELEFEVRKG